MEDQPRKVTRYIWPDEAIRLVRRSLRVPDKPPDAVLLHHQLEQLTGFSSSACWRFLRNNGIQRPGSGKRTLWNPAAIDKVIDYVMEHGYDAAVEKYGCTKRALYCLIHRMERNVGHCSGHFGLNLLRRLLSVRIEVLRRWINDGQLEAIPVNYGGKESFVVSDDQLRQFLSRHAGSMLLRRIPQKRIEFLSEFLYDKSVADLGLLRTRESKKENDAYEEYMASNGGQDSVSID
jgi:hypothetical protein